MFPLTAALSFLASFITFVAADAASDLSTALTGYPALSGLRQLVNQHPFLFNTLVADNTNITVLAPSNDALVSYGLHHGAPLSDAPADVLVNVLSYHVLAAGMNSSDFTSSPSVITIPTLLNGELYNNRSAGTELIQSFGARAGGQVVLAKKSLLGDLQVMFAGSSEEASLTMLDIVWSRGLVHMVDKVFELPMNCSETMEEQPLLESLYDALDQHTDVYDAIDLTPNVTCLGPSNAALDAAENPLSGMNSTEISWFIRSHTLPQPLYLDHLRDGLELRSLRNTTIKVTLAGGEIFFNNAKVIQPNVITNNGVIHVLDSVIKALTPTTPTAAPPTVTVTVPAGLPTKSSAAHVPLIANFYKVMGVLACLLTALL